MHHCPDSELGRKDPTFYQIWENLGGRYRSFPIPDFAVRLCFVIPKFSLNKSGRGHDVDELRANVNGILYTWADHWQS